MGEYNVTAKGEREDGLLKTVTDKFLAAANIAAERVLDEDGQSAMQGDGVAAIKVPLTGLHLYCIQASGDASLASKNVGLVLQLAFQLGYLHAKGLADEEMTMFVKLYEVAKAQHAS